MEPTRYWQVASFVLYNFNIQDVLYTTKYSLSLTHFNALYFRNERVEQLCIELSSKHVWTVANNA